MLASRSSSPLVPVALLLTGLLGLAGCAGRGAQFTPLLGRADFALCVDGLPAGEARLDLVRAAEGDFVARERVHLRLPGATPQETHLEAELRFAGTTPHVLRSSSTRAVEGDAESWARCRRASAESLACEQGSGEERWAHEVRAGGYRLAHYQAWRLWAREGAADGESRTRPVFDHYGLVMEQERADVVGRREGAADAAPVLILEGRMMPSAVQVRYAVDETGQVLAMQGDDVDYRQGNPDCSKPGWW